MTTNATYLARANGTSYRELTANTVNSAKTQATKEFGGSVRIVLAERQNDGYILDIAMRECWKWIPLV